VTTARAATITATTVTRILAVSVFQCIAGPAGRRANAPSTGPASRKGPAESTPTVEFDMPNLLAF